MSKHIGIKLWLCIIPAAYILLLLLGAGFTAGGAPDKEQILVGAIRWDAWVGDLHPVGTAVEKSLSPEQYHYRVPFYGREISDGRIQARCVTQEIMDQEIAYAQEAGLDFWAFVWYEEDSGLDLAWKLYLSSTRKNGLHYALILEDTRFTSLSEDRLVECFLAADYQKVLANRPLFFLFGGRGITKRAVDRIRRKTVQAGLGTPYLVLLRKDGNLRTVKTLGLDAVSLYATSWIGDGAPYRELARADIAQWGWMKDQGYKVLPHVTTGWDKRPRHDHPVFWEPDPGPNAWVQTAAPGELTAHLREALAWIDHHPSAVEVRAILIYAWNEFDEGGYICPNLPHYGGKARLDAVRQALFGL